MIQCTDEQIKKLVLAFQDIDFTQPKAHEVFKCLERTLKKVMGENATWREYYFFKLGRIANIKKLEFNKPRHESAGHLNASRIGTSGPKSLAEVP